MNRNKQLWGLTGLSVECVTFLVYVLLFIVWRIGDLQSSFALFHGVLSRFCVRIALSAIVFGIVGLIWDKKKWMAGMTLVLIFPELTIMGIISGHW